MPLVHNYETLKLNNSNKDFEKSRLLWKEYVFYYIPFQQKYLYNKIKIKEAMFE